MKSRSASRGERRRGVETWRGCARRSPGWKMQLPEESGAAERPVCRATKTAEEETNKSLSERSPAEGNRGEPRTGWAAEWAGKSGRGDSSRGTKPGWGVPPRLAVRAGIPKTDTARRTPPPFDCPLPGARPLLVTCPPANGSLSPAPVYYLQAVPPLWKGEPFCWVGFYPRLLTRPGESPVCREA